MEPLRVDFTLSTPMSESTHPIHLDSLVAWSAVQHAREQGDADPLCSQESLPFAQQSGVWCASALSFIDAAPPFTVGMTKKTSTLTFAQDKAKGFLETGVTKLDIRRGPWRQALFFQQCRYVTQASAWCIGDRRLVEDFVRRIRYLGSQRRNGRGCVTSVHVVSDDSAIERWKERVMPKEIDGFLPIRSPVAPPYWDRAREVSAWVHPNVV